MAWDATVSDSLAQSYQSAAMSGSSAVAALRPIHTAHTTGSAYRQWCICNGAVCIT